MIPRLRTVAIVTAAAVGGPYAATETEWGQNAITSVSGIQNQVTSSTDGAVATPAGYLNHAHYEVENLRRTSSDRYRYDQQVAKRLGGTGTEQGSNPQLAGSRVNDLREVMRFDISPDWLIQRFARVSTVLADLQLEGLRVPVVTGTRADDLAGTLTYYFDRTDKLQRITLHGFTGDPNRLVGTMTRHYGLSHEPSLEAGVYTKRWNGEPVHFLRMTHAPVVHSDAIHQKYTVFMELNQPNLAYGISPEAKRIVHFDHLNGRW